MSQSVSDQYYDRLQQVEDALSNAEGAWTGVWASLGSWAAGNDPKAANLKQIGFIRDILENQWAPRGLNLAPNDVDGWRKWIDEGNANLTNLRGVAQDATISSLDYMVIETVKATTVEVAHDAVAVAKGVAIGGSVLLVGALVVGGWLVYTGKLKLPFVGG